MRHRLVEELFRVLRRRHCCKVHSKRTPGNRRADLSAVQHRSNTTPTNDEKRSATKSLIRWNQSTSEKRPQALPTLHTAGVAGSSPVSPTRKHKKGPASRQSLLAFESWKIELVPRSSRIREQSGTALLSKMDSVHARLPIHAGLVSCPGADGRVGPRLNVSKGKGSLDF